MWTDTQEEGRVMMKSHSRKPGSAGLGPPEAARCQEGGFPQLRESTVLPTPRFPTSGLQNGPRTHSCYFKAHSLSYLVCSSNPRKLTEVWTEKRTNSKCQPCTKAIQKVKGGRGRFVHKLASQYPCISYSRQRLITHFFSTGLFNQFRWESGPLRLGGILRLCSKLWEPKRTHVESKGLWFV